MLSTRLPFHSTSTNSPTHQRNPSDDFISRLSPMNAIDTFRAPSGPLKACMDAATTAEQSFAIRAAIASKNIYEWLDELRDWPWPEEGGIGFQTPAPARGGFPPRGRADPAAESPSGGATAIAGDVYLGSLLQSDIARYETRIGQIQGGLDKLDIEEIKRHVLQHHIMPLSRPGTPASPSFDRHFGMPSLASYTKMDDLTAVITATVVQALPNLSKLLRLMNAWRTRLSLLRRVPSLMSSLSDAETAVQSGFSAIEQGFKSLVDQLSTSQSTAGSKLPHTDFEVMQLGLDKKISRASHELDYMLDTLEGRDDTLPDQWIDRMEAVEQGFADWIAAREKMLRDAQSAALRAQTKSAENEKILKASESAEIATEGLEPSRQTNGESSHARRTKDGSLSGVVIHVQHADDDVSQPLREEQSSTSSLGDADTSSTPTTKQSSSPAIHRSTSNADLDADYLLLEPCDKSREPALPLISVENSRPSTAISDASTTTRAPQDPQRTPDLLPTRGSRGSPHTPPKDRRSASMSLGDMPPVLEGPEDEDTAPTPPSSSVESVPKTLGSPFVLSDASGEDDHLRRQINEILEKIPAKVHLSSQTTAVNHLNPPDLQLPYSKPRSTADKTLRSRSSMSSRAGTPSFMLAPVSRPRQQRGNQDIKLYHLSRGTGEPPIKLYIRCVGERVMVRVGGGWADLGEYLKEYAFHHSRRSQQGSDSRVEVRDMPRSVSSLSTRASVSPPGRPSPPSRPASAAGSTSPIYVKKTRKPSGGEELLGPRLPRTPIAYGGAGASEPPSSGSGSTGRSRSSSGISSAAEGDSSLGMAGPKSTRKDISQESLEWVESIKEKVRAASSSADMMRAAAVAEQAHARERGFGDIGKIGGTKRLFRKAT